MFLSFMGLFFLEYEGELGDHVDHGCPTLEYHS